MIERGRCKRAGLLGTQGIRGGANRDVLKRIKDTGDIFFAESDRPWILEGANIHVSMVGSDNASERGAVLDGRPVATINLNHSTSSDTTAVVDLAANEGLCFLGDIKVAPFDINEETGLRMLRELIASGRANFEVVFPWVDGLDVSRRYRGF